MFAEELRRAIEAANRITLPQVTALLWRAYADGNVTDAEAEHLSGLIEARTLTKRAQSGLASHTSGALPDANGPAPSAPVGGARRSVGSRPRTDASMERRRRWAASGRLPPALAARFTLAEQAVLGLVAAETVRRGDCRLAVGHLAAIAGVAETTVRNAIREARKLGLLSVEERRVTGFRNDTNIVRIVAPEWTAWLRLARKNAPPQPPKRTGVTRADAAEERGCKSAKRTHTQVLTPLESRITQPSEGCRGAAGDLDRVKSSRIRAGGRTARAMR